MAGGRKRRERGVALVTVMALIASIGVLVASAVAISQYSAAETDTLASLQRSALEAESAANRTLCLLLADRAKNADRRLGAEPDGTAERFLADGSGATPSRRTDGRFRCGFSTRSPGSTSPDAIRRGSSRTRSWPRTNRAKS